MEGLRNNQNFHPTALISRLIFDRRAQASIGIKAEINFSALGAS